MEESSVNHLIPFPQRHSLHKQFQTFMLGIFCHAVAFKKLFLKWIYFALNLSKVKTLRKSYTFSLAFLSKKLHEFSPCCSPAFLFYFLRLKVLVLMS
jgi:hypothetical protein